MFGSLPHFIAKCYRYFITKCKKSLIQNSSGFLLHHVTALLQNAIGFLLRSATVLLQNATVITKCVNVITKCNVYYKMRQHTEPFGPLLKLWAVMKEERQMAMKDII